MGLNPQILSALAQSMMGAQVAKLQTGMALKDRALQQSYDAQANDRANADQSMQAQQFTANQQESAIKLKMLQDAWAKQNAPDDQPYTEQDMQSDAAGYGKLFNVAPQNVLDALHAANPRTHGEAKGVYYKMVSQPTGQFEQIPGQMIPNPDYVAPGAAPSAPTANPMDALAALTQDQQPGPFVNPALSGAMGGPQPVTSPQQPQNAPPGPTAAGNPMMLGPSTQGPEIMRQQELWKTWDQLQTPEEKNAAALDLKTKQARDNYDIQTGRELQSALKENSGQDLTARLSDINNRRSLDHQLPPLALPTGTGFTEQKVNETARHNTVDEQRLAGIAQETVKYHGQQWTQGRDRLKQEAIRTGYEGQRLSSYLRNADDAHSRFEAQASGNWNPSGKTPGGKGKSAQRYSNADERADTKRISDLNTQINSTLVLIKGLKPDDNTRQEYLDHRHALQVERDTLVAKQKRLQGQGSSGGGNINYKSEVRRAMGKGQAWARAINAAKANGKTDQQIYEAMVK